MWEMFKAPLWFFMGCVLFSSALMADEKPSDVRIIIDISGSMKENDPNNLRIPALKLLIEMLPEGSRAGVWTFGKFVNMLVPLETVNDQWRSSARIQAEKINSVGLRTDISSAFEKAFWKVKLDSGFKHSVILLTDGMVDISTNSSKNKQSRQKILEKIIPLYRLQNANIHTIALSDNADKDLLEQIALETSGMHAVAHTSEELLKIFVRAFDQAVATEQLPFTDNAFQVDASVKEFTALIFRQADTAPVRLMDPDGVFHTADNKTNNIKWFSDEGYDLITVRAPKAGDWLVEAELDPENRVTIVSDMSLGINDIPTSIFAGDEIELEVWLEEHGNVIKKTEFLNLVDVELRVTAPSGRSGAKLLGEKGVPSDGVYRENLKKLRKKGDYQIRVRVEGKTFSRQRLLRVSMVEPISVTQTEDPENNTRQILVNPSSPNIDSDASRIMAKITGPDQHSIIKALPLDDDSQGWGLTLDPTKGDGEYSVTLTIKGKTKGGREFKLSPEPITLVFPVPLPVAPETSNSDELSGIDEASIEPSVPPVAEPVIEKEIVQKPTPPKVVLPIPDLAEKLQKPKEIEPEVEVEVEEDNFWLYVAIAVASIVLFGLIIFAVIMLVRKKKEKQQGDPLEEEPEAMGAVVLDDDYSEDAVVNVVPSDDITDMLEDDVVEMSANASQINGGSEAPSDALVEQLMEEDEPTLEDVVYEEDPSEEDLNDFDQAFDLNDTDDIAVEASKNESNSPNEQSEEVEPPENEIDNISIDDLMADERDSDVESKIASDDDQQSTVDNATEDKKISDAEALADEIFASEGIEMDEEMPDLDDLLSDLDFDDDEDTSKN